MRMSISRAQSLPAIHVSRLGQAVRADPGIHPESPIILFRENRRAEPARPVRRSSLRRRLSRISAGKARHSTQPCIGLTVHVPALMEENAAVSTKPSDIGAP